MITATCKTDECEQSGIAYYVLGDPEIVECGRCASECDLSDPQPDPEPTPPPPQ